MSLWRIPGTLAFADTDETATATLEAKISVLRMIAADMMVFAGVKLQILTMRYVKVLRVRRRLAFTTHRDPARPS